MTHTTESRELTTADVANLSTGRDHNTTDQPSSKQNKGNEQYNGPLLPQDVSQDMRTRWEAIQTAFVDDPRASVQQADELVASAIRNLAQFFADERTRLEQHWSNGSDVSTEDMRQALRHYRAFFQRLLSV